MYDERVYWIWLQHCIGTANSKVHLVRDYYESAYSFYEKAVLNGEQPAGFSLKETIAMRNYDIDDAAHIFDKTLDLGYDVISYNDRNYPEHLRNIENPPAVLYVWGDFSTLKSAMTISVVGTRSPMKEHYDIAYKMCEGFAINNVTVVSGGALGIDTAAHQGTLSAGGKTVAVLGCGLDFPYLTVNAALRKRISQSGAVITEYPLGTPASANHFPVRNRIIAALSVATVMIQGKENSGTMITVNYAIKYNKKIFAVPGNPAEGINSGNNSLIANGALPVTNYKQVLRQFFPIREIKASGEDSAKKIDYIIKIEDKQELSANHGAHSTAVKEKRVKKYEKSTENVGINSNDSGIKENLKNIPENTAEQYQLEGDSAEILKLLSNAPTDIDELVSKSKMSVSNVLAALTELEILGIVEKFGSRSYKLR